MMTGGHLLVGGELITFDLTPINGERPCVRCGESIEDDGWIIWRYQPEAGMLSAILCPECFPNFIKVDEASLIEVAKTYSAV